MAVRNALLILLLAWILPLRSARAEPPGGSPFNVRWDIDVPIATASLLVGLMPEAFKGELRPPYCGLACDKSKLNALDRTVVGNHSKTAARISDVLLITNIGLPGVLDLIDVSVTGPRDAQGYGGLGKDLLILSEVAGINFAINNVVKFAVSRPRPLVYDPSVAAKDRQDPDAGLSFYSGHSSMSFAMATAYSYLFTLRHPRSPLVLPVWLFTEAMAATTAVLRVAAGKHFWTDVLTGAGVGASIGILVPILHRQLDLPAKSAMLFGTEFRLLPTAYPGGGGIMLAME